MALVILVEPIFKVEAALTRLKVEAVVVTSPPFTAISPVIVRLPLLSKESKFVPLEFWASMIFAFWVELARTTNCFSSESPMTASLAK